MTDRAAPAPAPSPDEATLSPRALLALRVHRGEITELQAWRELKRVQHEGADTMRLPVPARDRG